MWTPPACEPGFTGSNYIQQIVADEINEFARATAPAPSRWWPGGAHAQSNLTQAWFGALMEIINNVTMLSIIDRPR